MSKGDVFNRNLIIHDIQSLTDLYADQGYAFVEINPITSDFLNSVNIDFEIFLNKKTYINRITFQEILVRRMRSLEEKLEFQKVAYILEHS